MLRDDKSIERNRYDNRASILISENEIEKSPLDGSYEVNLTLRAPYSFYEDVLQNNISKNFSVLEIGAGT